MDVEQQGEVGVVLYVVLGAAEVRSGPRSDDQTAACVGFLVGYSMGR